MQGFINRVCSHLLPSPIAQEQYFQARSHQRLGLAHYRQGEYDLALSHLESALTLWTVLGNFRAERRLFQVLGQCYSYLGQSQAAQCCREEAQIINRAISAERGTQLRRLSGIFVHSVFCDSGDCRKPVSYL